MQKSIITENHTIGDDFPPYIIAEIGLNHNGDIDLAIQMAKAAARSGASAAKFQMYKSERFIAPDASLGDGGPGSLRKFFQQFELTQDEWKHLASEVRLLGLDFFCSVFDEESLDFYLTLDPRVIKIASTDIDNIPLLNAVSKIGLPVMLSTGASNEDDIVRALGILRDVPGVLLFLCVSSYPAGPDDYPLGALVRWKKEYQVLTGLSDHTSDSRIAIASAALKMDALEKHFTLNRLLPGPDQSLSINPDELSALSNDVSLIRELVSRDRKAPVFSESAVRTYGRRSLYLRDDLKSGSVIGVEKLIPLRPGGEGISVSRIDDVVGKIVKHDLSAGTLLREDILKSE